MAIKRIIDVTNAKSRICLKCAAPLPLDDMKDDTVCTCRKCDQRMTVDRNGNTIYLTVIERPDIRHRKIKQEDFFPQIKESVRIQDLTEQNNYLKKQMQDMIRQLREKQEELSKCQQKAKDWEKAADNLARYIERTKAQAAT